jgi:hypothetical protein
MAFGLSNFRSARSKNWKLGCEARRADRTAAPARPGTELALDASS